MSKSSLMCDRIGVVALSLAVFFAIIAFLPGGSMMAGTLKGYLVVSSVLVALVAWLLGRIGKFDVDDILGKHTVYSVRTSRYFS